MHYKFICVKCNDMVAQCRCPSPMKLVKKAICILCEPDEEKRKALYEEWTEKGLD